MSDQAGGYAEYRFTAEFYDHLIPYSTRGDVAFFVEMAQASGGPVLEVGCGTGRVLIPTARAGVEIVGLDLSPFMLAICRENLAQEPPEVQARVQIVEGDMRDFDLGREFALDHPAVPPLPAPDDRRRSDGVPAHHPSPSRAGRPAGARSLQSVDHLSGRAATHGGIRGYSAVHHAGWPSRCALARITARDYFNQIQDVDLIYYVTHPDGRQERLVHSFPMRYLFRFEAEHLLARCGFAVEALYGDYDKSPYGSKYPGELIFVAIKT